jgi:hypothetical protein
VPQRLQLVSRGSPQWPIEQPIRAVRTPERTRLIALSRQGKRLIDPPVKQLAVTSLGLTPALVPLGTRQMPAFRRHPRRPQDTRRASLLFLWVPPHGLPPVPQARLSSVASPAVPNWVIEVTEPDATVGAALSPLVLSAGPSVLFVPSSSARCPVEMALVADRVCVDRWEATVTRLEAGKEVPLSPIFPLYHLEGTCARCPERVSCPRATSAAVKPARAGQQARLAPPASGSSAVAARRAPVPRRRAPREGHATTTFAATTPSSKRPVEKVCPEPTPTA